MTLKGWNPLVLLPVAFFVTFVVWAALHVRRRNSKGKRPVDRR